jgi:hypothetical protein
MWHEILDSPAFEYIFFALGFGVCLLAALFWMTYLTKIVSTKDENDEKVWRFCRIAEEFMRGNR